MTDECSHSAVLQPLQNLLDLVKHSCHKEEPKIVATFNIANRDSTSQAKTLRPFGESDTCTKAAIMAQ